jgi:hypothetical protein
MKDFYRYNDENETFSNTNSLIEKRNNDSLTDPHAPKASLLRQISNNLVNLARMVSKKDISSKTSTSVSDNTKPTVASLFSNSFSNIQDPNEITPSHYLSGVRIDTGKDVINVIDIEAMKIQKELDDEEVIKALSKLNKDLNQIILFYTKNVVGETSENVV